MLSTTAHTGSVFALAFSPDGSLVSCGADSTLRLWDGPFCRAEKPVDFLVWAIAPQPVEGTIVCGGKSSVVHLWNPDTGTLTSVANTGGTVTALLRLHGRFLAIGTGERLRDDRPGRVILWNLDTAKNSGQLHLSPGGIAAMAAVPERKLLAWSAHRQVFVLDLTRQSPQAFTPLKATPLALAFSPDGTLLAAASDWSVKVYDVKRQAEARTLTGHSGVVTALAFAPDGRTLLTGSRDKTVRIWDATTAQAKATYEWPVGRVMAVAVSPDGLTAACAGDQGVIQIWDLG